MKSFLLFFTVITFTFQNSFSFKVDDGSKLIKNIEYQDKTLLIKKTKAKINALIKKRKRLKDLKNWSDTNETNYQRQIEKLNNNLQKLGYTSKTVLSTDEVIKKLQMQLKYLNNKRVNKNASEKFTQKDDSIYKSKAGFLLDSIIRLRRNKFLKENESSN